MGVMLPYSARRESIVGVVKASGMYIRIVCACFWPYTTVSLKYTVGVSSPAQRSNVGEDIEQTSCSTVLTCVSTVESLGKTPSRRNLMMNRNVHLTGTGTQKLLLRDCLRHFSVLYLAWVLQLLRYMSAPYSTTRGTARDS